MKKRLFQWMLLLLPLLACGQGKPGWLDGASRRQNYPPDSYYSGLAHASLAGTSRDAAIRRAETDARAEALSTLLVSVRSTTRASSFSREVASSGEVDEQYVELFSSQTRLDVAFKEVPGLKVEHYVQGNDVTAFAYVRRASLVQYAERKIASSLTSMETALNNADLLSSRGEKIRAREVAKTAVRHAADLENAQRMLLAADNTADVKSAQSAALTQRLVRTLSELKNATSIYLDCKAYAENKSYGLFKNDLKGVLSKMGCNFAAEREGADWIVSVEADVVRENSVSGAYFVWIDGAVAVRNNATGRVVYNEQISSIESGHPDGIKGAHMYGSGQAAKAAYKDVARIVGNKVSEIIKQ